MKKKKKPDFSKPKQLDATQEIQQINAEETDYFVVGKYDDEEEIAN